jgi:hypothetical protein
MSERNGDKSRFHRERKQNIHRRKRTRELLQVAGIRFGRAGVSQKPDVPAGSKDQPHE